MLEVIYRSYTVTLNTMHIRINFPLQPVVPELQSPAGALLSGVTEGRRVGVSLLDDEVVRAGRGVTTVGT